MCAIRSLLCRFAILICAVTCRGAPQAAASGAEGTLIAITARDRDGTLRTTDFRAEIVARPGSPAPRHRFLDPRDLDTPVATGDSAAEFAFVAVEVLIDQPEEISIRVGQGFGRWVSWGQTVEVLVTPKSLVSVHAPLSKWPHPVALLGLGLLVSSLVLILWLSLVRSRPGQPRRRWAAWLSRWLMVAVPLLLAPAASLDAQALGNSAGVASPTPSSLVIAEPVQVKELSALKRIYEVKIDKGTRHGLVEADPAILRTSLGREIGQYGRVERVREDSAEVRFYDQPIPPLVGRDVVQVQIGWFGEVQLVLRAASKRGRELELERGLFFVDDQVVPLRKGILRLPPGKSRKLKVSYPGYEEIEAFVDVPMSSKLRFEYVLSEQPATAAPEIASETGGFRLAITTQSPLPRGLTLRVAANGKAIDLDPTSRGWITKSESNEASFEATLVDGSARPVAFFRPQTVQRRALAARSGEWSLAAFEPNRDASIEVSSPTGNAASSIVFGFAGSSDVLWSAALITNSQMIAFGGDPDSGSLAEAVRHLKRSNLEQVFLSNLDQQLKRQHPYLNEWELDFPRSDELKRYWTEMVRDSADLPSKEIVRMSPASLGEIRRGSARGSSPASGASLLTDVGFRLVLRRSPGKN